MNSCHDYDHDEPNYPEPDWPTSHVLFLIAFFLMAVVGVVTVLYWVQRFVFWLF